MKRLFSRLGPGAKQALNLTGVNGIFLVCLGLRQLSEYLPAAGGLRPLPAGAPERHRLGGGHRLCGLLGHGQRPAGLGEKGAHRRAGGRRSVLQPGAPHPRRARPYTVLALTTSRCPSSTSSGAPCPLLQKTCWCATATRLRLNYGLLRGLGSIPVHRGQPDHLLPAALCGGGEHLLALRRAHAHPHRFHLLLPGAQHRRQAGEKAGRRHAPGGAVPEPGPTCCFWGFP